MTSLCVAVQEHRPGTSHLSSHFPNRLSRGLRPVAYLLVVLYPLRQRVSRPPGTALYLVPPRGQDKAKKYALQIRFSQMRRRLYTGRTHVHSYMPLHLVHRLYYAGMTSHPAIA